MIYLSIYLSTRIYLLSSIYFTVNHLVPHPPLWKAVQDLYSTDPTQETFATIIDHADYTGPTRLHELDRTDHTDRKLLCALKYLHVSEVRWFLVAGRCVFGGGGGVLILPVFLPPRHFFIGSLQGF